VAKENDDDEAEENEDDIEDYEVNGRVRCVMLFNVVVLLWGRCWCGHWGVWIGEWHFEICVHAREVRRGGTQMKIIVCSWPWNNEVWKCGTKFSWCRFWVK